MCQFVGALGFLGKLSIGDLFKFIENTVGLSICTADAAVET